MLTKAILTGVVLAGLSGSIVYFGTEGADALDRDVREDVRLNETELAGAADAIIEPVQKTPKLTKEEKRAARALAKAKKMEAKAAKTDGAVEDVAKMEVGVETPPVDKSEAKPKRKWLDQYLKSNKAKTEENPEQKPVVIDVEVETTPEVGLDRQVETEIEKVVTEVEQAETEVELEVLENLGVNTPVDPDQIKRVKKKIVIKMDGNETATWTTDGRGELMGEDFDMEMIEDLMREHEGDHKEIRVLRLDGKTKINKMASKKMANPVDYDLVLNEAKKLQVLDMRNQAVLEIMDYAIDSGDIGNAADIVDELSSPELRDTARAKIGVGLATRGDAEAAFAVLEEIEIDELTAPIRLEIIAALMATKAERSASKIRR